MRDTIGVYLNYIPHPDEPDLIGERDFVSNFWIRISSRRRAKKHVLNHVFH